ncbi:AraC family transcriptional regulator [Bradyrhizobium huanghuaihaiense]|uniref:helix-turn-helix domain-containing protein n=1 Tax=Bradyrhizobium huanghuaihaiense TaxID=990078 RepID=UPI0021A9D0D6|nr:AraC family transcriptional regulator [Bradyrhizobium sp. CB3035]UWU78791.1 AraC family transcriptional regulator [Bradyrhizobium sp. CB3035]
MFTDLQAAGAWSPSQPNRHEPDSPLGARAIPCERRWRQPGQHAGTPPEDITISRWVCTQADIRQEEATTPCDRYFLAIALKTTPLKLSRGRRTIFDGIMPAGTLYVGAPSQQLCALFSAPYDFLHFHPAASVYFPCPRPGAVPASSEIFNDLLLLRDPFAEQLAKALTEHGHLADREFARCIGRTLAMHVARHERPHTKVNALAKWRLRRVEEYVGAHFERCISLSQLAKVAGLSRMHFAAQFRVATGYRPREYLLHERVERAKSMLSSSDTPLAEVALAVGFCTQAHFSTVFKRMTGDTPARWRSAVRNASASSSRSDSDPASAHKAMSRVLGVDLS